LKNPQEILKKIPEGSTIVCGGFGLCGVPENIIRAMREIGTKNLTVVSNNCGNTKILY
jgi:acyl CoA:acetate/3-ketoacid CoA transferase alpha subunit